MKQEVCHRIMSESFIDRTHSPRYINLKNDQIRIDIVANTNKDGNTESAASTNATEKSTGVDTADASSEGSDSDADTTHNQKKKQKKKINLKAAKTIVDLYGERLTIRFLFLLLLCFISHVFCLLWALIHPTIDLAPCSYW